MARSLYAGALAALSVLAAATPARAGAGEGRKYAFLVACSRYEKAEFKSLPYTGNDIEVFRKALLATGFDADHIFVLRDDQVDNQDRPFKRSILQRLAQVVDGMRPQDMLVVALSGHGLQFKNDPVSYFVPVDGKAGDRTTLLPLNGKGGLYERLKACPARQKLLIVNACRNDPTVSLDFAASQLDLADEDRPEEVPEGIAAIYSCKAGQKSYYDPERKLALFFDHVARAWKGEYSGGGPVTLEAFFAQVQDKTKIDAMRSLNRGQVPVVMRDYRGEWVITTRAAPKAAPKTVPPTTNLPPPSTGVPLFNGKDLTGWEPVGSGKWSVAPGGILTADGMGIGWLATQAIYTDFELELEYRLPPGGNSGIFLRAFKSGLSGGRDFNEVQLMDDAAVPNARPVQLTGGLYNQVAPHPALRPAAGQWHRVVVRAEGSRVQVTINGTRVLDADAERAGIAGHVGLQVNRTSVEFRNIRLRTLPSATRPLFNGRDLTGWAAVAGGRWTVAGGILTADGSGSAMGWLATEARYGDFELDLEYRISPRGNSGIFLRAWKDGKGGPAWGTEFVEVQLQDDAGFPGSTPLQLTGSLYNRVAPSPALKPAAGEWHKVVVRARGSHVQVTINGQRVVDAAVNLRDQPGYIGLQVNRSGVEFRNIYIRELGK